MLLDVPKRVRPLRRLEFDRLVELGAFERERLELIDGAIISMGPQGSAHAAALTRLIKLLLPRCGDAAELRVQMPFAASATSEPEPDLAVVPPGDYEDEHPGEALLLIEVADASLPYDRTVKAALYARAGVPEYWIVDLEASCVEVHRAPRRGRYTSVRVARPGDALKVPGLPRTSVDVADFFARPART